MTKGEMITQYEGTVSDVVIASITLEGPDAEVGDERMVAVAAKGNRLLWRLSSSSSVLLTTTKR
jgi:hypothetical protein